MVAIGFFITRNRKFVPYGRLLHFNNSSAPSVLLVLAGVREIVDLTKCVMERVRLALFVKCVRFLFAVCLVKCVRFPRANIKMQCSWLFISQAKASVLIETHLFLANLIPLRNCMCT